MTTAILPVAKAEGTKPSVYLVCEHSSAVSPADAAEVCNEFFAFVRETKPEFDVFLEASAKPQMGLTVTKASPRAIAMEVVWTDENGQTAQGIPLQMAFFDRNSDPQMRKRFYTEFMRQNPIPF